MKWDEPRIARFKAMWDEGQTMAVIADAMATSPGALYVKASALGFGRRVARGTTRRSRNPRIDSAPRVGKKHPTDKSGQRRFLGWERDDGARVVLDPWHAASREGATIYGSTVLPASKHVRILKAGKESRKLGNQMTKGRWKGQMIFALTLEERETCPRTCLEWSSCYGNNMPFSHRIADDGTLTRRLWGELAALNAQYPGGFVVRLHVLGDFYSLEYAEFWRQALIDFPALNVFGFTARMPPADPIGIAVAWIVADNPQRFIIRFSGADLENYASEVIDRGETPKGILCPAESDAARCCATCGLCMQTTRTITFIRH